MPRFQIRIEVMFKPGIPNPLGDYYLYKIHRGGYPLIKGVAVGKFFDIVYEGEEEDIIKYVTKLGKDFLANRHLETHRILSIQPIEEIV